ncbi:toxic anion resistance protein [Sphingomonas sp. S2-65]|uniref:toxic anion resistance protein n=1 Tax=Sphingomonas sp. S2-65 TaxID=2903960 RepID=UPI001F338BA5|nr:toxic anion resistance protein [Sphingomonas sp. S2-65]UYY59283.1 toxic anion resistance protein [Sphingomonas sp. S2-65]
MNLNAPTKRNTRSLFGRGEADEANVQRRIEALVESLERERDTAALSLITIESDSKKLHAAAEGLDNVVALIRACAVMVEAAGRELRFDRPDRARFFSETVAARLLARERDVVTQTAVTQQGMLTLQLLLEGQTALAQALGRARDTSIAALRTALATRRAVAESQGIARQADALERTARAAGDAPARGDLQRALDDAVDQARRAIDAARAAQRGTAL